MVTIRIYEHVLTVAVLLGVWVDTRYKQRLLLNIYMYHLEHTPLQYGLIIGSLNLNHALGKTIMVHKIYFTDKSAHTADLSSLIRRIDNEVFEGHQH